MVRQPEHLSNPAGGNLCDITEVFDANIANFVWCVEKTRIKFLQYNGDFNSKSSESSCVPCGIQTINLEKLWETPSTVIKTAVDFELDPQAATKSINR